jgi:hypothetical protein
VPDRLRASLDLLLVHPFVTWGGARYRPSFGAETLLAELPSEHELPERGGVIDAIGLPRRRGLARRELDHALLGRGVRVCEDLGLDPFEYRLVCLPFDVQVRAAERLGWGRSEVWTHLDGYQVTRELRLMPLVGGNAHFGAPYDLCSVSPSYDSSRLVARLAVVRRMRAHGSGRPSGALRR